MPPYTEADRMYIDGLRIVPKCGISAFILGGEMAVHVLDFEPDLPLASTTPTIYNVTMTLADTEYSQLLPADTKRFSLQCLTDFDIRFAFETGRVAVPTAPYALTRAGMNYYEEQLNLAAITLFVACPDAGQVAEIIAWT